VSKWRTAILLAASLGAVSGGIAVTGAAEKVRRTLNWDKVRDASSGYREVVDLAGLAQVGIELPVAENAEDLAALCEARREGMVSARSQAEDALKRLGDWSDPMTDEQRVDLWRALASIAGFAGDIEGAVRHLQAARDLLASRVGEDPKLRPRLLGVEEALAVADLRQGEVDNCMVNSSADRCLFPVRPGGRHVHPAGAEAARTLLQAYLAERPEDLEVRWLLNVANMVLGRYPQDVPKDQLLPPSLFASRASAPRFVDVARSAGLGRRDVAGGTITEDLDGDGLLDVVFSSVDYCSPLRLYRNLGNGRFEDRSEAAGLAGQLGGINVVQTDYDNDGRIDLFVMRGGWEVPMRNSLLHNNGDGTFSDVTEKAGLLSGSYATHSAAWADYDNDGFLDLYVGHEFAPSQLFHNRGDGTFEDVTARAGVGQTAFTKGVAWGDYDEDGWPDLYVSNMAGENFLYHNNGDGTFTDVAGKLGVQKPLKSFATWFFDYDNDGWPDLFVASFTFSIEGFVKHYLGLPPGAETMKLYRNRGDGTFADVTEKVGLDWSIPVMGANFGDIDNDGFLDMYLGTGTPSLSAIIPNIMLKNDGGRRFLDVTEATGTGHLQKGHGVAFADLDNDGDEDVVLNVGGSIPGDDYDDALFENPGGSGNNWISIKLVGVKTNRPAVGARITLRLRNAGPGSQLRYREVSSGGSFGAQSFTQHIGLGRAHEIDTLEVYWPTSKTRQTFRDVPVNAFIQLEEFAARYTVRELPRFKLGGPAQ
jgi:ASPIC and UnbV/FG-GAP-like repeat